MRWSRRACGPEHRGAHFWVVAAAAAASVWLGLATGRAARGRGDARLVADELGDVGSATLLTPRVTR